MESLTVGKVSKTDMALMYISNIADMKTVNKIRGLINNIDIDNIAVPAFIEEYLIEKSTVFSSDKYTRDRPGASNLS